MSKNEIPDQQVNYIDITKIEKQICPGVKYSI